MAVEFHLVIVRGVVKEMRRIAMAANTGSNPDMVRKLWRASTSLMASLTYLEEANSDRQANIRITLNDNLQAQIAEDDQLVRDRLGGIIVREFVGHEPAAAFAQIPALRLVRGEVEAIQERVPEQERTEAIPPPTMEQEARGSGRAAKRRRTDDRS